ncbi:ATP-binding cassette domain-containing protein [Phyllobacterium sp. SB3]|uniref:ABC transporter ATP-binding protein/permease n=1 Tax=Phyllobacterium sp. SB3 TaxID=3156073 RepID=UPI0032AF2582
MSSFDRAVMKAFGATDHVMTVVWTHDVTPGFRRIRLHAPTMIDGRSTPTASFLRLWAPDPDGSGKVHQRGYTLIDPDPKTGEVTLDFVMHHPAGPAASWAAAAKPGDTITASYISYTKFEVPEPDPEGYLLIGDPSAIPAINSILEILPDEAEIVVVIQAVSPGDETIPVTDHPGAHVNWLAPGNPEALAAAIPVRDWSNWHAWLAGESGMVKHIRLTLNQQHGFPLVDIQHRAYWMRGKAMRLKKNSGKDVAENSAVKPAPAMPELPTSRPPVLSARWRSQRGKELLASLRWKLRVAGILQAMVSLLQLVPFILLAEIGRKLLEGQSSWSDYRIPVIATLVLFGSAAGLSTALLLWLHAVDARFGRDLRRSIVSKLARLPLGWFSDRNTATVRQAVQDDAGRLHYAVTHAVPDIVAGAVTPLAVIGYLFTVDAALAGVLFLPLLAFVIIFSMMLRGNGDNLAKVAEWKNRTQAAAGAFAGALPVVRVFGGDGRQLRQVLAGQADFLNGWQRPMAGRKVLSQLAIQPPTFTLLILAGGIWRISTDGMTSAELLPFLFLGAAFGSQIMAVAYGFVPWRDARAAASRIGVLLEETELDHSRSIRDLPQGRIALRFRDVSFGYRSRKPVLHGITLDLEPGTLTALVGPSGAGKSTLAALPGRFHDVTGGAILLSGSDGEIDIRELRPEALQRNIGFVFQDVRLIRASLRENISLARPDATIADIEAAARAARIHDRILSSPRGYDSVVGEDAHLSGGEAQRLSIARLLLADPAVLILDEATAFADPESEHLIQEALSALTRHRTVLVVAHRLHTVIHADFIAVLEAGRIVQRGRHEELMTTPGLYRKLWHAGSENRA